MTCKVLLIGGFEEGKTTLIKRIGKQYLSYEESPSESWVIRRIEMKNKTCEVWDCLELFDVCDFTTFDVVVFMFTYENTRSFDQAIADYQNYKDIFQKRIFLVGNKADLGIDAEMLRDIGRIQIELNLRIDHISARYDTDEQLMKFWEYITA